MENQSLIYGPLRSIPLSRLKYKTKGQRKKESHAEFILVRSLRRPTFGCSKTPQNYHLQIIKYKHYAHAMNDQEKEHK